MVIGGFLSSTFLTLLVVPVIFFGIERLGSKKATAKAALVEVQSSVSPASAPAQAAQG